MGAGLRAWRRYESCRGSLGQVVRGDASTRRDAMRCVRERRCGSVRRGVRRSGGGGCARRRHAFAELWVGSGRLSGDSREGSRNGSNLHAVVNPATGLPPFTTCMGKTTTCMGVNHGNRRVLPAGHGEPPTTAMFPGQRHWPCPDRGDRSGAEVKSGVLRRGGH